MEASRAQVSDERVPLCFSARECPVRQAGGGGFFQQQPGWDLCTPIGNGAAQGHHGTGIHQIVVLPHTGPAQVGAALSGGGEAAWRQWKCR